MTDIPTHTHIIYIYHAKSQFNTPVWGLLRSSNESIQFVNITFPLIFPVAWSHAVPLAELRNFICANTINQFNTKFWHKQLELTKYITPHANGKPLLKWSSSHSHSSQGLQRFCLLSGLPTVMVLLLPRPVPMSIY